MTGFCCAVAALIAIVAWMLRPARAGAGAGRLDAPNSNLALLKTEWSRLDVELAGGLLGADEHRAARDELQRRVLAEAPRGARRTHPGDPRRTWLAASLGAACFALLVYGHLGNPSALDVPAAAVAQPPADPVAEMIDTLAHRLDTEPELARDASAWTLLARTRAATQRFADASAAYARAIALTPGDVQLLADRADVLAMLQGGRLAGEPQQLIDRALAIDPDHPKALALAGSAALERNDSAAAIGYWERARQHAPPDSAFAIGIERSLAAARPPGPEPQSAASPGPALISGRASLAPALAARVAPTDTVFVTARAVDGPRMPLAVLRRQAAELPFDFRLDDSMAMSGGARLSQYPRVWLSVRISRSGNATPQSGDLYGLAEADAAGGRSAAVVIEWVQP